MSIDIQKDRKCYINYNHAIGTSAKKYPLLSKLYSLVKEFYSVLFSKKPEKLDFWMESARKYNIPKLQTFVEGITNDLKASKMGFLILIAMD